MKPLGAGDVRRIADLARLRVGDEEAAELANEFRSILEYLERLSAVDTKGVETIAQALPQVLRGDTPAPCLDRGDALAAAPDPTDDGAFGVPHVLDTDG